MSDSKEDQIDPRHQYKLDPRIRRIAKEGAVPAYSDCSGHTCWLDPETGRARLAPVNGESEESKRDRYAETFIEVANIAALERVRTNQRLKQFVHIVDGYCSAMVPLDQLAILASDPGVVEVEAVRYGQPLLNHAVSGIHGRDGLSRRDPAMQSQGAGVVIGIVDYGLDFTLADFRNSDGKTRIAFLWDQQLTAAGAEESPKTFGYGVEYTARQINRALRSKRGRASLRHEARAPQFADVDGHGTHVTGIAAGNGRTFDKTYPSGEFTGVAPGATIVFVNLNRADILAQVQSAQGTLSNSVHLAHAIAYCFEKADALGLPCVVNLSMGFNGGGHDGNTVVEWIIDALLQKSGRAVVVAAGNEDTPGRRGYHGDRVKEGSRVAIGWENGDEFDGNIWDDPSTNEMEIWHSNQSRLHVRLIAPDGGEASGWVVPDEFLAFDFAGGEHVEITSDQATPWDGAARIYIQLGKGSREGIRFGTWTVELEAASAAPEEADNLVRFDAWIERTTPGAPSYMRSRFKGNDTNQAITLTTPSTARRAITVASCADVGTPAERVSDFSGRGPTRDGRNKPELSAPGQPVFSTNAGAGQKDSNNVKRPARVPLQGTSMAAPIVTGVVARLLSRQSYLSAAEIRRLLVESADDVSGGRAWDPKWGYGRVNAWRAMQLLEATLRSPHEARLPAEVLPR